jgi:hypothetical protein
MKMKKYLLFIASLIVITSCNRSVCPAYMNGESTGLSGDKGKKQELFPSRMDKKN